ncbi:hypothetical protein T261_0771 [Streptomyces lydicus]|nr:hypothetical protein T261_0771 [Streptomyces lydicus]
MKTCQHFARIRSGYQKDIRYLHDHAERRQGTKSGKILAMDTLATKRKMAKALNWHLDHCRECG